MEEPKDLILSVYDLRTNPQFVLGAIEKWLNGRNTGTFTVTETKESNAS